MLSALTCTGTSKPAYVAPGLHTFVVSAMRGIWMLPSPPFLRGVLIQARWLSSVSVLPPAAEQAQLSNAGGF